MSSDRSRIITTWKTRATHRGRRGERSSRVRPTERVNLFCPRDSVTPSISCGSTQTESVPEDVILPDVPFADVAVQSEPVSAGEVVDLLEMDLLGYLRHICYGAKRTEYTPASLNRQAGAWCEENKSRLGVYKNYALRASMIARCVNAVLPPGLEEAGLIGVYRERGQEIKDYNRGLAEMGDQREDLRWIVGVAGVTCVVLGVASRVAGRPNAATALAAVGIAGAGLYGVSKARDFFKRATRGRWW